MQKSTTSIRITADCQAKLTRHLVRNDDAEHLAFALAGSNRTSDAIELLVRDVILVSDEDLVEGARPLSLELDPRRLVEVINKAVVNDCVLIELHNHPLCTSVPHFSYADEQGFRETVPYMLSSLKTPIYSAVVVSESGDFDGLVWLERATNRVSVNCLDIVSSTECIRQSPGDCRSGSMPDLPGDALERFNRQVRAFGKMGQQRVATLRVGLVGLGGIGSVVAQLLSRMGVCYFVLIDPDIAETSNLSRIPGATQDDVRKRSSKVDIAARNIRAANPNAEVLAMPVSVYSPDAMAALTGTDLIIGGTDDVGSRFAVNDLALAHLRPFLDLATEIHTNDQKLTGVGGRYTFAFPGDGCLLCSRAIDSVEAAADFVPREVKDRQRRDGYIVGSDEPAPSVMPLNSVVASLAAMEVLVWTTGVRPVVKQVIYDGLEGTITKVAFERLSSCDRCRNLLGRGDAAGLAARYRRWAG